MAFPPPKKTRRRRKAKRVAAVAPSGSSEDPVPVTEPTENEALHQLLDAASITEETVTEVDSLAHELAVEVDDAVRALHREQLDEWTAQFEQAQELVATERAEPTDVEVSEETPTRGDHEDASEADAVDCGPEPEPELDQTAEGELDLADSAESSDLLDAPANGSHADGSEVEVLEPEAAETAVAETEDPAKTTDGAEDAERPEIEATPSELAAEIEAPADPADPTADALEFELDLEAPTNPDSIESSGATEDELADLFAGLGPDAPQESLGFSESEANALEFDLEPTEPAANAEEAPAEDSLFEATTAEGQADDDESEPFASADPTEVPLEICEPPIELFEETGFGEDGPIEIVQDLPRERQIVETSGLPGLTEYSDPDDGADQPETEPVAAEPNADLETEAAVDDIAELADPGLFSEPAEELGTDPIGEESDDGAHASEELESLRTELRTFGSELDELKNSSSDGMSPDLLRELSTLRHAVQAAEHRDADFEAWLQQTGGQVTGLRSDLTTLREALRRRIDAGDFAEDPRSIWDSPNLIVGFGMLMLSWALLCYIKTGNLRLVVLGLVVANIAGCATILFTRRRRRNVL